MLCGIDEAGRGPLAGPVCAASVILKDDFPFEILNDSKKLNHVQRMEIRNIILEKAFAFGIGWATHTEIDEINILQASLLAMKRSFEEMIKKKNFTTEDTEEHGEDKIIISKSLLSSLTTVIVDGKFVPNINFPCTPMVKADAQVPQVMAASILAKTERDTYMEQMAKLYPKYGYEKHKGYPTKAHKEAVKLYGASPIQRLSFKY
ncbi:MAG: ribonuclease HII [Treponema sp.]|nr:ribonuclease HII [Treponema sp.]